MRSWGRATVHRTATHRTALHGRYYYTTYRITLETYRNQVPATATRVSLEKIDSNELSFPQQQSVAHRCAAHKQCNKVPYVRFAFSRVYTVFLFFLSFFFKIKSNQSPFLLFCCVQSWIQRPLIGKRWQRWQRLISIYSPAVLCRCCFCFFLLLLLLLLSSSSHYTRNAAPMKPTLQQRPTKSSCSRLINNSNEWRWYTVTHTHTHTQSQKKRKISGATGISSFPLMVGFDFFFPFAPLLGVFLTLGNRSAFAVNKLHGGFCGLCSSSRNVGFFLASTGQHPASVWL